ncbi:DUF333 domain-containing protein [Neisseriaceae bacterium TC5R-5]|nr:DUF333 domain-containing protein [Neisseriaceae bacterium TC5R-5]
MRPLLLVTSLCLGACAQPPTPASSQLANPASVYCVQQKQGELLMKTAKDGGVYGVCKLPDGSEVEEWELYRREHAAK